MNHIEDVLEYADNIIFDTTGENLAPVEEAIIKGVWEGKKYWEIAVDYNNCSEDHIKKEAAKLWKKLGEALGENFNKGNFRSKVEKKHRISQRDNFGLQVNEGNINICDIQPNHYKQNNSNSPNPKNQTPKIDLTKAPELNYKYGGTSEITTLKQWILENHTRLITIYGLSGIGKTALTLKLISDSGITTEFDYIIYRSLDNLPKLITLKNELKQFFSQSQSKPLPEIIDYFFSSRCLVILDDVENIFQFGNFAGQYLNEYKDYGKFFKQIATSSHQSCVILISSEKPPDIETLESENQHTKTLHLQGLGEDAKELLREKGLKDDDKWDELIKLYQGHPVWLKIITLAIKELFNGQVSQFLIYEDEVFLGDIEALLENHLERLSDLEKQVIKWLAMQDEQIDISQKPANLELSNSRFLQVLQSLNRRCLVEKVLIEQRVNFNVNSLFRIYINQ